MIGYNDIRQLEDAIIIHRKFLTKQYKQYVPKKILSDYLPPEYSLTVNDDPDQYPIELVLPEPPPLHTIDGFGLSHERQYFRVQQMPTKLAQIVKANKAINEVWAIIHNDRKKFRDEILWIQKMWTYRLYGYWFYNDGVPTYIDGTYFYYLNTWHLGHAGLPTYRLRDRIFFLFAKYCKETTEAPFFWRVQLPDDDYFYFSSEKKANIYTGQHGLLVTPEKGLWIKDYGSRTSYGFNYPKHRREGATFKACCKNVETISKLQQRRGTILSKDGDSAKVAFKVKISNPFKKVPFYFMPQTENLNTGSLSFTTVMTRTGKAGTVIQDNLGLMSELFPTESADERKGDGEEFEYVHGDEVGKYNKARPYNLAMRHNVMKKTVAQFPNIRGLMINTSTSDDTKGEAGRRYMELCAQSHWHERDYVTGLTESGLFNLFIPAYINLDGYSDLYGNPIIYKPTAEQKKHIGNRIVGAKQMIESLLLQNIEKPDVYYNDTREFPCRYRDCFMTSGEESGFDIISSVKRISELDMNDKLKPRIGNLEWVSGWGTTVEFIDKLDGKFQLSYYPDKPNASITQNGKLLPANTHKFVSACDPFRFEVTRSRRHSKGAGVVYLKRDVVIDPDTKETSEYETDRVCCTYENNVSTDEYSDDMLKMAVFYGCEIFPEMNEEMVYKYIDKTKYKRFLGYLYINGVKEKLPGFYTQTNMKQIMFKLIKLHIERNVSHEKHRDLLQQLVDIGNISELVDYDLIAAFGGCLLAQYYPKHDTSNIESQILDTSIMAYIENIQRR